MESTKDVFRDKSLRDRYKIIEELKHNIYQPRIYKCLDKWSGKLVILKLIPALWKTDPLQMLQIYKGLLIASDLQQQSDNFLKINDISYYSIKDLNGYGFVVNTEFIDWTLDEAFKNVTFNYEDKIRIFYKILMAVSELEAAGVVHTNLNPNHILISKNLQNVKICGLVNNAMLKTESYSFQNNSPIRAYKCVNANGSETMFRPLELLAEMNVRQVLPTVSSAMDVWSLGAIFAYILNNGIPIFGKTLTPIYYNVFYALANPTQEDLQVLKNRFYSVTSDTNKNRDEKIQEKLQVQHLPHTKCFKWTPLLAKMFQYQPLKRITIQELMDHNLFVNHFTELENNVANAGVLNKAKKMDQISIHLPDISTKPGTMRELIVSLLGTRRSFADEKRQDLIVLACNLGNATAVPAEIWITIFMYANTNPVMYALRANKHVLYNP